MFTIVQLQKILSWMDDLGLSTKFNAIFSKSKGIVPCQEEVLFHAYPSVLSGILPWFY